MREGKILLSPGYAARSRFTPRPTISKNGRNSWCSSKEGSRQRWGAVQMSTYKATRGTNHPCYSSCSRSEPSWAPRARTEPAVGRCSPGVGLHGTTELGARLAFSSFFFFLRCKRKVCISNPSIPSTTGCLQGATHSREAGGTAPR